MRVLIANERLLFRFGLDRVLLVLARMLRERGHEVALMANRLDAKAAASVADHVVEMPATGDYLLLNETIAGELDSRWDHYFPAGKEPDLALIGGWPFFAAIPVLRKRGVSTVFLDCGAVPLEGMSDGARITQEKLRAMRKSNLPYADAVIAISSFIERTQSLVDAPGVADIRALLLGADHLADSEWTADRVGGASDGSAALQAVMRARQAGQAVVLNLGRWEAGCYKNSEAIFGVARALAQAGRKVAIAVLESPDGVVVPEDLRESVLLLGHPDDRDLARIIDACAAGLSVSRWEGFNLPVAELQWAGKPAFALDVGAHPEVVCDRWFLAGDEAGLARRIDEFLRSGPPETWQASVERFRGEFSWRAAGGRYIDALEAVNARARRTILVDATNACLDPANSGVMRVVRRGSRALQDEAEVLFAVWSVDMQTYVWPTEGEYAVLAAFNGPVVSASLPRSGPEGRVPIDAELERLRRKSTWLLIGETIMEQRARAVRDWARASGLRIAAIFYDAIPVLRPDLVADTAIRDNHARYMAGLSRCDAVIPISSFSAASLGDYWASRGCTATLVRPCLLPDEMGGARRPAVPRRLGSSRVDILCVSTVEPRKGHLNLLAAVKRLAQTHAGLDWSLTLVGNRYAGGDALALAVAAACEADPRIRWLGIVDDARLNALYAAATFTVYCSTLEGYGMPIVESLWHGTPCICHNDGVMAELAGEGGCLTTDMSSPEAIAAAMARLSTDAELYAELTGQIAARATRTWRDYSGEVMEVLEQAEQHPARSEDWEQRLYPGCLTAEWQMTDSERLAMTGLLHRHKPRMAIEIGTYRGGSLSLISQYAKNVISIDIDPAIPERYSHFKNVRFITGYSQEVLPPLLDELERAGIAVDFVLIDGDHSAAGVKRDIELVISRIPLAPMFIMLHDGFNPECRRGMLEADWQSSAHVRWVDTDFIPGRVIEAGAGTGEMWGGLGCAYLTPERRDGPLVVRTTAGGMWKELKESHYGEA